MDSIKLGWYKLKPEAVIPTKTPDNAGYDIYTIEKDIMLMPHEHRLFSTGLAAVVSEGWWLMAMDRGSTGSKGIHIHCGVIDNNYRGEIFICLNNDNDYPVKFTDTEEPGPRTHTERLTESATPHKDGTVPAVMYIRTAEVMDYFVYPTSKAIAQIMPIPQPVVESYEIDGEAWKKLKHTDRGDGKLGSSGK